MSRLRTFLDLPAADQRRLLAACALVVSLRVVLAVGSLAHARRWAAIVAQLAPGTGETPPERVAWAVRVAGSHLPSTCLYEALAARALLSRAGHDGHLHVGVRNEGDAFEAHAWVSVDGEVLVGGLEDLEQYRQLPAEEAF